MGTAFPGQNELSGYEQRKKSFPPGGSFLPLARREGAQDIMHSTWRLEIRDFHLEIDMCNSQSGIHYIIPGARTCVLSIDWVELRHIVHVNTKGTTRTASYPPGRTTTHHRFTNSPTPRRFSINNAAFIIVDLLYLFFPHSYIREEQALEAGSCQAFEIERAYLLEQCNRTSNTNACRPYFNAKFEMEQRAHCSALTAM